ncbi:unnamed protein product [Acanthoscelides obtectus]|uniref:MATH domain-containing protein n=1 Tax=Acanthoscelides obtectus TaxID=200917 RepID=A0A9P0PT55_ACAOB|nr:unnamed protein product [Acanthoscelides obtectus]CAK1634994.1 hypothetical protein AOBTE_LOCUS8992 [Acanthoscelides obtectus]
MLACIFNIWRRQINAQSHMSCSFISHTSTFCMYIMLFLLVLVDINCVEAFYITSNIGFENKTAVEEVQNAVCTISTQEFEASANATISRQLKGVCSSAELKSMLTELEKKMTQGFDEIKQILRLNAPEMPIFREPVANEVRQDELKRIPAESEHSESIVSLEDEIYWKNDTVDPTMNVYYYFWKVENIRSLIQKFDMYHSSPEFSIMGHILYLQLFPNYPETGFLSLQLGRRNNSFLKKHEIYILAQLNRTKSLKSSLLYSLKGTSMFTMAENTLENGYISDDAIIVKVKIYLNSYFLVFLLPVHEC